MNNIHTHTLTHTCTHTHTHTHNATHTFSHSSHTLAARGLDIPSIKTVINFDVAKDIDTHVHRIGRTGRAGEKGTAFTLVTSKDVNFAGDLVRNLVRWSYPEPVTPFPGYKEALEGRLFKLEFTTGETLPYHPPSLSS